jgi:hypothetical protein
LYTSSKVSVKLSSFDPDWLGPVQVHVQGKHLSADFSEYFWFASVTFPAEDGIEYTEAQRFARVVAAEFVHVQAEAAVERELDERDAVLHNDVADLLGAEFGPLGRFAIVGGLPFGVAVSPAGH